MSNGDVGTIDRNRYPFVGGVMRVTGATIWAYDGGDARVVPWKRRFGNIEAGYFGCVPAPEQGWNRYVDPDANQSGENE